jgi:hypothetical protein
MLAQQWIFEKARPCRLDGILTGIILISWKNLFYIQAINQNYRAASIAKERKYKLFAVLECSRAA